MTPRRAKQRIEAAAAVAAEARAVVDHMLTLTSCPTGTPIRVFAIDKESETGRKELHPGETNYMRFTMMKHIEGKDGEAAGILMLDASDQVNGVKRIPCTVVELREKPGPGKTELVEEQKLSDEMMNAPSWFLYYQLENLPSWLEALNQQYYGLALGTITNELWSQRLREQANSVFTGTLPLLYQICGISSYLGHSC